MIWLQISTRDDFDLRQEFVDRLTQNFKKLPKSRQPPREIRNLQTKGKNIIHPTKGDRNAAGCELEWEPTKHGATRAVIRAVKKGGMEVFFLSSIIQRLHDNFQNEIRNISIQFKGED
jgi:hypothetical protein